MCARCHNRNHPTLQTMPLGYCYASLLDSSWSKCCHIKLPCPLACRDTETAAESLGTLGTAVSKLQVIWTAQLQVRALLASLVWLQDIKA